MILEFKTKRNTNGNYKYLMIDTDNKLYTRFKRKMIVDGIEIKARDYKDLIDTIKIIGGYKEI